MRILHLDSGRQMRGGQWQALLLIQGLRARGHAIEVLARKGSPLYVAAKAEGFNVRAISIIELLRKPAIFDIVHAHDSRSHTLAALAGTRSLVVARRVAFDSGQGMLSRWKYSKANHFIAVSRYVGEKLLTAGIDESKVSVVYDGVPLLEPEPMGDRLIAPATDDRMKGSALASAAARLAGVDLHFSTNLSNDLPGARGLLYLTHEEGLGSGVLLAMMAGVPVLASAVGGLPEIVEDGVTGLLTENKSEAIAVRLTRLMQDEKLSDAMVTEARNRAVKRFTIDAMVDATVRVYEQVAK